MLDYWILTNRFKSNFNQSKVNKVKSELNLRFCTWLTYIRGYRREYTPRNTWKIMPGRCENCYRTDVKTKWRGSEQNLCDYCELTRVCTLQQQGHPCYPLLPPEMDPLWAPSQMDPTWASTQVHSSPLPLTAWSLSPQPRLTCSPSVLFTPEHTRLSASSSFTMDQSSLSADSSNVSDTDPSPGPREVASSESATPASGFMEPADIASALRQLTAKINESACVKEKVDTLQKENMALRAELEKARRELALAKSEIDSSKRLLDERSNSLAIERSLRVSLEKELDKTKPPRAPDLVIGSSLIRDLDAELYVNTEIIAESGACPEDLQKLLEEKAHEGKHYDCVIVVAGKTSWASMKRMTATLKRLLTAWKNAWQLQSQSAQRWRCANYLPAPKQTVPQKGYVTLTLSCAVWLKNAKVIS